MKLKLPSHDLCTGCAACVQVCFSGALQMTADVEGFLYPVIKGDRCSNCGKCAKICPVLKIDDSPRKLISLFAAYSKDDNVRKNSSSGGIFFVLARRFIRNGGVVFGAAWDRHLRSTHHIMVSDEVELKKLSGSKYVQSDTSGSFTNVRELLRAGCHVMFSGTPCQLAGLRAFLGQPYENLFMVEIVCHGVPSPLVLKRYLEEVVGTASCDVKFRDKIRGWREFSLRVTAENGELLCESMKENVFLRGFLSNLYLRRSCSKCRGENKMRGDVVLADYWNIKSIIPNMREDNGVSAVIVVTEKGRMAFKEIEDEIVSVQTKVGSFLKSNRNVLLPTPRHPRRDSFFRDFSGGRAGIVKLTLQNLKWTMLSKFLWKLRRHYEKKRMAYLAKSLEKGECI